MARGLVGSHRAGDASCRCSGDCRWPSRAISWSAATISARRRSRNRPRSSGELGRLHGRVDRGVPRRPGRGLGAGPARARTSAPGRPIARLGDWGDAEPPADGAAGRRPHRRRHGRVRRVRVDRPHDRPERRQHRAAVRARRRSTSTGTRSTPRWPTAAPSCCRPARSTRWRPCGAATPTSTSPPAWAPRSPPSTSWPNPPGRSTPARTARPARP